MPTKTRTPNFDRVARLYRWAEYLALGPLLQQTRCAHLRKLHDRRRALLFGDGDGRFLARLLAQYPALRATAIDISGAMLRLLRERCRPAGANRFITLQTEAQHALIQPGTDLIVTHFFLDCLTQPEVDVLASRIAAAVQPGTLWLVSDFAIPANWLLRNAARLYVRSLYLAFRVLTGIRVTSLPDPQSALAAAGFQRVARDEKLCGLLYSELWAYAPLAAPIQSDRHNPAHPDLINFKMEPGTEAAPQQPLSDPLPDPEPIAPSLDEPDPGVFHHEPGAPQQPE